MLCFLPTVHFVKFQYGKYHLLRENKSLKDNDKDF